MKIEYETGRKDYLAKILELCEEYVQENGRGAWSDGQWGAFEEVRDYVKYIQKRPGRPSTGFDKKAYMKEYMRKRRALLHPKPIRNIKGKTMNKEPSEYMKGLAEDILNVLRLTSKDQHLEFLAKAIQAEYDRGFEAGLGYDYPVEVEGNLSDVIQDITPQSTPFLDRFS